MHRRPSERSGSFHRSEPWSWEHLRRACEAEARGLLDDEFDAQDATQEALIRAWTQRHACRSGEPDGWARRIARNEALRLGGRKARQWSRVTPEPAALESVAAPESEAGLELAWLVAEALAELEPADRLLLRLRYERDLTQAHIAQLLGLPEGTVKVRLHRIRRRLRARLS